MAKILVIDDDLDIAQVTAMVLKQGNHEVDIELNEHKALERVKELKPDCVVLDVMFPYNPTAGFELSRKIRAQHPKLPIIMVTSMNEHASVKFSNKDIDEKWLPIDVFMEKPVQKEKLLSTIKDLLK